MFQCCWLNPLLDDRYRRAQLALGKGDEDLAREALKRRKAYAVSLSSGIMLKEIYYEVLSLQENSSEFVGINGYSFLIFKMGT